MNKRIINNRQELLQSFQETSEAFEAIKNSIKKRESLIKEFLANTQTTVNKDPLEGSKLPQDNSLRQAISSSLLILKDQMIAWDKSVKNYACNAEFREKYGDSLLVFVYGKVKSGKSSLGNYIAYGISKPTSEIIASTNPRPCFFLEANTGKNEVMTKELMNEIQAFGVGSTETTSSIQGFTLSGLTWIDSPGIHSMTPDNGNLAKDYANAADIIVFLSNSTSPARQSDLQEISQLLKQKKPLVILVTHSDIYEYNRDCTGKLIKPLDKSLQMKSKKDQTDQVNYFHSELEKLPREYSQHLLDTHVYPISTAYVELSTDHAHWQDSGMSSFAQLLTKIATSQGVALKKSTPLKNLLSFFEIINAGVDTHRGEIKRISNYLKTEREQLAKDNAHILGAMRSELSSRIERLADQHAMDDTSFKKACSEVFEKTLRKNINELLYKLGQRMDNFHNIAHLSEDSLALPKFDQKTETVDYQSTVNIKRGKALGTAILGTLGTIGAALVTGGTSLLVTGGIAIASALVAGAAGEKLGELLGRQFDGNKSMTVNVGDNRQEVSLATRTKLLDMASTQLQQLSLELDEICFKGIENWLNNLSVSLDNLHQALNKQQTEITDELSAIIKG